MLGQRANIKPTSLSGVSWLILLEQTTKTKNKKALTIISLCSCHQIIRLKKKKKKRLVTGGGDPCVEDAGGS
jgi:hypothetical protein